MQIAATAADGWAAAAFFPSESHSFVDVDNFHSGQICVKRFHGIFTAGAPKVSFATWPVSEKKCIFDEKSKCSHWIFCAYK